MAARASDESFETLFEPYRRSITLHCYRMLGSLQDAEEMVQETFLRAWQRRDEVRAEQATRAWLYKIATNACLDHLLKARRRRSLPHLVAPSATGLGLGAPTDPRLWVEPAPEALVDVADDAGQRPDERASLRESIGLAFILALQLLSPKQRAALILVDVLGFKPQEAAELLETSTVSVNSLLQRARRSLEAGRDSAAPREVSSSDEALLRRFITTWENGDLEGLTALLADDAILSMPPHPEWFEGREAIKRFYAAVWAADPAKRRVLPLVANGEPAVAVYRRPTTSGQFEAVAITILAISGGRIHQMTRFAFPRLFSMFGLASQLPA